MTQENQQLKAALLERENEKERERERERQREQEGKRERERECVDVARDRREGRLGGGDGDLSRFKQRTRCFCVLSYICLISYT